MDLAAQVYLAEGDRIDHNGKPFRSPYRRGLYYSLEPNCKRYRSQRAYVLLGSKSSSDNQDHQRLPYIALSTLPYGNINEESHHKYAHKHPSYYSPTNNLISLVILLSFMLIDPWLIPFLLATSFCGNPITYTSWKIL